DHPTSIVSPQEPHLGFGHVGTATVPPLRHAHEVAASGAGDPDQTCAGRLLQAAELAQRRPRIWPDAVDESRHDLQEKPALDGRGHLAYQANCSRERLELGAVVASAEGDVTKLVDDRPGDAGRVVQHRMNEDMRCAVVASLTGIAYTGRTTPRRLADRD